MGISEDVLWFYAMFFFTVPPVLRFRENFLVPLLCMLMVYGFYTQAYGVPDFYNLNAWPQVLTVCGLILISYFICGFFVHFFWFKGKSAQLREVGAFGPLLEAWIKGKAYVVADGFVSEIRRLRMFEVTWDDIKSVNIDGDDMIISDDIKREAEMLSEIRINKNASDYDVIETKLNAKGLI